AATLRRATGTAERTRRAAALSGATAAGTTAEPAGGRRTATAVTTTAATRAATATGSTPATGARTGPGTRDLARPRNTRPRRHVARRHAGTRRGARPRPGTGPRARDRPVGRLRRGERIVTDPRGARRRLGRSGCRTRARARGRPGRRRGRRLRSRGLGRRGRLCRRGRFGRGAGGRGRRFRRGRLRRCRRTRPRGGRLRGGRRRGLGHTLVGPLRCTLGGGLLVRGGFRAVGFAQPTRDRGLHRGGRRFDELALLLQGRQQFLAGDTEFLCQLVYASLCHYISCLEASAVVGAAPRVSYDTWSSGLHGVLMFFATCPSRRVANQSPQRRARSPRLCPVNRGSAALGRKLVVDAQPPGTARWGAATHPAPAGYLFCQRLRRIRRSRRPQRPFETVRRPTLAVGIRCTSAPVRPGFDAQQPTSHAGSRPSLPPGAGRNETAAERVSCTDAVSRTVPPAVSQDALQPASSRAPRRGPRPGSAPACRRVRHRCGCRCASR